MVTSAASGAIEHRRLEVVEDQVAGTAAEEGQGVDQAPVEFGFALRQGELDVEQPAMAEHGHEHRDLAGSRADRHAAAFAPIDLHGLGRLVMHLLVDAATCRTDLTQVAAQDAGAAGITLRPAGNLLADAHGRQVGILGQQVLDLVQVRMQQTGARGCCAWRRLLHLQGGGHRVPRAVQTPRDHPAGEFINLAKAADFGP